MGRVLFLPSRRERHLELSREQLDMLKRKKRQFISDRFREIVTDWRIEKTAQQSAARGERGRWFKRKLILTMEFEERGKEGFG